MEPAAPQQNGHDRRSVVTIGTYDGVHLGHRRLIDETMRSAKAKGATSVVVTFGVHPVAVLRPDVPVALLCTQEEKMSLLRATGIDEIVVLDFDLERARESAEDFVTHELSEQLGVIEVVVGSNFRFGHDRRGDVALLEKMGAELGFVARGIELVLDDELHSVVSSTRIRALIGAGDLHEAGRLLGRPVALSGTLHGSGAFVVDDQLLIPPPGRYSVEIVPRAPSGGADRQDGTPGTLATAITIEGSGDVVVRGSAENGPDRSVNIVFSGDREPTMGDGR